MDTILLTASIVAGALTSAIFNGLVLSIGSRNSNEKSRSLKTLSELELAELRSLKIENDILQESISKIYHAYKTNLISKLEYDKLQARYGEEIRICRERLTNLQANVDFKELQELRRDLYSLIENKIRAIDEKLTKFSSSSTVQTPSKVNPPSLELGISPRFGAQIKRTAALEHSKIEKLQKEVLKAVANLDRSPEAIYGSNDPKEIELLENKKRTATQTQKTDKKDALNNLV
jgi:hypothetical protein